MDIGPLVNVIDSSLQLLQLQMKGRPNEKELEPAIAFRNHMMSDLQAMEKTASGKELQALCKKWRTWIPPAKGPSLNPAYRFVESVCEVIELS